MATSIKSLKGKLKPPVRSVTICLDGELWAKHDELTAKLADHAGRSAKKLAVDPVTTDLGRQITEVEQKMREAEVTLEFRGLTAPALKAIQDRFPLPEGAPGADEPNAWDIDAAFPALVAATAVEPTTEEEAKEFADALNQATATRVFNVIWLAATGTSEVPTNAHAFVLSQVSGSK